MTTATFESLWKVDESRLAAYALNLARNLDDADDILQLSRVKAWRAFPNFQMNATFSTWAMRIIKNAWLDELKRKRYRLNVQSYDEPIPETNAVNILDGISDASRSAEDLVVSECDVEEILSCITDAWERALLVSKAFNFSEKDIAIKLDLPVGTVKSRYNRLRIRLQKELSCR